MPASESLASPRLWLAFATMLLVSGIGNAFPVFFPPLLAEFGGSRAATASTVSLLWISAAVLGPVAGVLVDRRDPRLVVVAGLGATALGLTGGALAPTLGAFIVCVGVGGGIGVGLTGMVAQAAVIADSFVQRRGFATGIAFAGSMAGYVLAGPAHWAITLVGWRATLAVYTVLVLALVPLVLRVYPARLQPRAEATVARDQRLGSLARGWPFWALAWVFTIAPLAGYLATVQHALYFSARGFGAEEAATMLLVGGVLSTSGRALAGLACDRVGAPLAGIVSHALTLVGFLCLIAIEAWPVRALAWAYVLFVFLPLGTRATIVSVLVSRIAPPARYGSVFGALSIFNSVGAALGPFLSGALYDVTRSYLAIFAVAAVLVLLALAAFVAFLRGTAPVRAVGA